MFMVSMHEGPVRRMELHRSFVDAAARNRVGHVVYLSFVHPGPQASFIHARTHGATEHLLRRQSFPGRRSATACMPTTSRAGSTPTAWRARRVPTAA